MKYRGEQLPQASAVLYCYFNVLWEGKQTQQVTAVGDMVKPTQHQHQHQHQDQHQDQQQHQDQHEHQSIGESNYPKLLLYSTDTHKYFWKESKLLMWKMKSTLKRLEISQCEKCEM